jgi:hypothetical protein
LERPRGGDFGRRVAGQSGSFRRPQSRSRFCGLMLKVVGSVMAASSGNRSGPPATTSAARSPEWVLLFADAPGRRPKDGAAYCQARLSTVFS